MKHTKKLLVLLLAMIMIIALPLTVSAEQVTAGTCGENVSWTYEEATGALTISGTGDMANYESRYSGSEAPWWTYTVAKVVIEPGVTSIGNHAFDGLALTDITIPGTVKTIGERAFLNCTGLTSVTIPQGVRQIGESAFRYCRNLAAVTLPYGLEKIGKMAFYDCGLTGLNIPKTVYSIGEEAFGGCDELTSATIPCSVSDGMFYACHGLTAVTIEEGARSIGNEAFYGCDKLESITIPDSVYWIGTSAFYKCEALKEITLPEGIESISESLFAYSGLESITIPESVTQIGANAFWRTKLTSVTIPKNVTFIDQDAFGAMAGLSEIYFTGDAPRFAYDVFSSSVTATAYYPADNDTWIESVMQNYGGNITWVPYGSSGHRHDYVGTVTEPTCTEQGYTTYTCECGDSYVDDYVEATGHYYATVVTAPTCTEQGYTTYTCPCGDSYVGDYVDVIDHTFGEWVTVTEPTLISEGEAVRTCECGETETKVLPRVELTELADVNADGKLNAKDATIILRYAVGKYPDCPANFEKYADVNGDGKVNAKDATLILRYVVGKAVIEGWE